MNNKIKLSLITTMMIGTALSAQLIDVKGGGTWNTLSINETPKNAADITIASVKAKLGNSVKVLEGIKSSEDTLFPLTTLTPNKGFYIFNPDADGKFEYEGLTNAAEQTIESGWNYLGFSTETDLTKLSAQLGKDFDIMINGTLVKGNTDILNSLTKTNKGSSYWIKSNEITNESYVKALLNANSFFDIDVDYGPTKLSHPRWTTKSNVFLSKNMNDDMNGLMRYNKDFTKIKKVSSTVAFTVNDPLPSKSSIVSGGLIINPDATIDREVEVTRTITSSRAGSDPYTGSVVYKYFIPSTATVNNSYPEITTYNKDGSIFLNGLTTSSNISSTFKFHTTATINDSYIGPESGVDYTIFLKDGSTYHKISFDSSYVSNGNKFFVKRGTQFWDVSENMAIIGTEDSAVNFISVATADLGNTSPDIEQATIAVNWDLIKGSNTIEGVVSSDLTLPTAINGVDITWDTNRKDIINKDTGVYTAPNEIFAEFNLIAYISKGNRMEIKQFPIFTVKDANIKVFNSISEAMSAGLTNNEVVIIRSDVSSTRKAVYTGTTLIDVETDEDLVNRAFKNGNQAYIERGNLTTAKVGNDIDITWDDTNKRWYKGVDANDLANVLLPYEFGTIFGIFHQSTGMTQISTIGTSDNGGSENFNNYNFDGVNKFFVSPRSSTVMKKTYFGTSEVITDGNSYTRNKLERRYYGGLSGHVFDTTKSFFQNIIQPYGNLEENCVVKYGKGWRVPTTNELGYTTLTTNNTTNITDINTAYLTPDGTTVQLSLMSTGKYNGSITQSNIFVNGTTNRIENNANGTTYKYRCVFEGDDQLPVSKASLTHSYQ